MHEMTNDSLACTTPTFTDQLSAALGVKVLPAVSYGCYPTAITADQVKVLVAAGKMKWQNPNDPHCGNKDGILYTDLDLCDDVETYTYELGFDVADGVVYVS